MKLSGVVGGLCWESLDALGIRGKMRRKRCGNAGKKVSSRRLLETSVSTQTPVAGRRRERRALVCGGPGPGISGAAQLGRAALFICPDLAFAPRLRDLLSERSHCPAGKICYKYLPWGGWMQSPWPAANQTRAVKIHYSAFLLNEPPPPIIPFKIIPPRFC